MLNNEKHDITEDGDNTENELFESAHFTMEEQIYIKSGNNIMYTKFDLLSS